MTKLSERLCRTSILIVITGVVISTILMGISETLTNTMSAEIIKGFELNYLIYLILWNIMLNISTFLYRVFDKTLQQRILNQRHIKYLHKILNSPVYEINKIASGKINDTINKIADYDTQIISYSFLAVKALIPFITLIYKEYRYNPICAVISVICILIGGIMMYVSDNLFNWTAEAKSKNAILQGITADNFINIRTLKYLRQKTFAVNRLLTAQKEAFPYMINIKQFAYFRIADFIGWLPMLLNVYLCRNDLKMVSTVILFDYTLFNMRGQILNISELIVERKAQSDIIKTLTGKDTKLPPVLESKLVLKDIEFEYEKDSVIFKIDKLQFNVNERYLITGESGSGKSSLANLISGAIPILNNSEYENIRTYYIWQETESFDDTLWHNIVFDNKENISESEVLNLLHELNMTDWFNSLKDGFNTQIGEKGCKLSSGQKQRINIIRTILHMRYYPEDVFILDEITSNLDKETKRLAISLIDRECTSTLICISHNEGFETICEHHILVDNQRFYPVK